MEILTVKLFHCSGEVGWILEADEAEAFGLVGSLVADHFGSLERRVLPEDSCQHLVCHVVT